MMKKIRGLFLSFLLLLISISAFSQHKTMISGKVLSTEKTTVDFATVYLKGTNYGGSKPKIFKYNQLLSHFHK